LSEAHILVVEDEKDLAGLIKLTLEREGRGTVEIVESGDAALRAISERVPDLIILDLNLPVLNGFEVCRILRSRAATAHIPIIMVTARTSESDRIQGFELGADDYVTKPFSLRELGARVRAVLRRGEGRRVFSTRAYNGKHLFVDFEALLVRVDGEEIRLTRREYELLCFLVRNRNRIVSRERLLERVWGYDDPGVDTRTVAVHVGRIRSKLGPAGSQIETAVGLGYRFVDGG
jgi:DNA-binding response OmpR family regulator